IRRRSPRLRINRVAASVSSSGRRPAISSPGRRRGGMRIDREIGSIGGIEAPLTEPPFSAPRPPCRRSSPLGYSNLIIDLLCSSERREKFQRLLSGELRFLLRDEVATLLELASLYVLGDRLPHRYNVAHECFASPGEHRHFQFFCAAAEVVKVFLQR